jgi:hypothetical protein
VAKSPDRTGAIPDDVRAIVVELGERCSLAVDGAVLLHQHSNAIVHLPEAGVVARIATNPDALERVQGSVRVTRWLAARGFPCTPPADELAEPLRVQGRVVSLWRYIGATGRRVSGAELGRILRELHDLSTPADPPDRLLDPLRSVDAAARDSSGSLDESDRDWLLARIGQLREAWSAIEPVIPIGLIHGDAHPGNLIPTEGGAAVLGDWDQVAIGPREWDLTQVHYTRRRFGRPSDEDLQGFIDEYGWDVRAWAGADTLIAVREITGLSPYIRNASSDSFAAEEVKGRLGDLRSGDTGALWRSPSDRT